MMPMMNPSWNALQPWQGLQSPNWYGAQSQNWNEWTNIPNQWTSHSNQWQPANQWIAGTNQ